MPPDDDPLENLGQPSTGGLVSTAGLNPTIAASTFAHAVASVSEQEASGDHEAYRAALEALDPQAEIDAAAAEAYGDFEKCGANYVTAVAKLKKAFDKLISETQINQNVDSPIAYQLRVSYRQVLSDPDGWKEGRHNQPGVGRAELGYGALNVIDQRFGAHGRSLEAPPPGEARLFTAYNIRLEEGPNTFPGPTSEQLRVFYGADFKLAASDEGVFADATANMAKAFAAAPSGEIGATDTVGTTAVQGVFFKPYYSYIDAGYQYVITTDASQKATLKPSAEVGYYLTMINYYLEMIGKQILIAQNLSDEDYSGANALTAGVAGPDSFRDRLHQYATNGYGDDGSRRYYETDSLLPLTVGYRAQANDNRRMTRSLFSTMIDNNPFSDTGPDGARAIFSSDQGIIAGTRKLVDDLQTLISDEEISKQFALPAIFNFLSQIGDPATDARIAIECIKEAWDNVINRDLEMQEKIEELKKTHKVDKDGLSGIGLKRKDFADTIEAMHYARNPEKLFFKEQCFLLSYIAQIAEHKKRGIDRNINADVRLTDEQFASMSAEDQFEYDQAVLEAKQGGDIGLTDRPAKKLLPYLGYTGAFAASYGPQKHNATLLLDGDPYGFLNKLVSGNEGPLLNIDHSVLSLLQPFIRLYKVEFDNDGSEVDIEVRFDSYRTSNEAMLFKTKELRNTGVGLKSFNFTYDGSNPFGAKKSIKATLKIFANTFDELMMNRGHYRYTDLALKTLNTADGKTLNNSRAIRRENENLAKLNFRLKAQVGWSVPDVATLERMGLTEKELRTLRSALYDSIVTLNLTPTVHDFEFDELGRVNFTINYLAYAEETYSQAKFNVFSEAEFAAAREERELKIKYYTKECESESVAKIKKEFALVANKEVSESISNLVSTLIRLDRIYYINVTQDKVKSFMSLGPFADDMGKILVKDDDAHQEGLQTQIDKVLKKFEEQKGDDAVTDADKGAISSALATTSPESTVVSFFYLSDLIDTILANIEREIQLIPEHLESLKASGGQKFTADDIESKIKEYRSYEKAFRKLRYIFGPVEFVNPRKNGKSIFANLGDVPVSVRYWFEWLTSTMLNRDRSYYSLTAFVNDLVNKMIRQFLNSTSCFNYNIRQHVNMQQAAFTGPQIASARKDPGPNGYVIDPITSHCQTHGVQRTQIDKLSHPVLKAPPSPRRNIKGRDEINYLIYFVGRSSPTEMMLGKKSMDEKKGIHHYQIGRDRGIVKDIKLKKTSTPGLQEVRFEQQGYAGLEQLRVTYDADIACYANPNTFPGTYLYVDPAGFAPRAKALNKIDLTKYGVGGYYMVIRSTHNFAPATATTDIEAKWVNSLHTDDDEGAYTSVGLYGNEESNTSKCTMAMRKEGVDLSGDL